MDVEKKPANTQGEQSLTPMGKIIKEWQAEREARRAESLRWSLQDIAIASAFGALAITTVVNVAQVLK